MKEKSPLRKDKKGGRGLGRKQGQDDKGEGKRQEKERKRAEESEDVLFPAGRADPSQTNHTLWAKCNGNRLKALKGEQSRAYCEQRKVDEGTSIEGASCFYGLGGKAGC